MNLESAVSGCQRRRVPASGLQIMGGAPAANEAWLKSLPIFSALPAEQLRVFAEELRPVQFPKGARIFHEGCDPDSFYLITEGWVKIVRDTASGRSVMFELRGPGQSVGSLALTDRRAFSASGIAATEVKMLVLTGKRFLQLFEKNAGLQHGYLREVNVRLREARDWQSQITLPIPSRIALLFTHLARRMGRTDSLGEVYIPRILTRQDIADMVGTTVETVIRTLSKWKQQELLVTKSSDMVIEDLEELSHLALAS